MSTDLREELTALAETQTFSPDPAAWDRGRRARRNARAVRGAAVLALVAIVVGVGAIAVRPEQETPLPASEVRGGAIPSRIEDPGTLEAEWDLAVGRASVAFFSNSRQPVVIGATDGRYHALKLSDLADDRGPLKLSPDGRQLAWRNGGRIHVVQLEEGTGTFFPEDDEHSDVTTLEWATSDQLLWTGTDAQGQKSGGVLPVGGPGGGPLSPSALRGVPSPSGALVALASRRTDRTLRFAQRRGSALERSLPDDIYPSGAMITPLGWATDDLVLAQVNSVDGTLVKGQQVALVTAPDRPAADGDYRTVVQDIPQYFLPLSVAVDLIPDLTGDPDQELTHDFTADDVVQSTGEWRDLMPFFVSAGFFVLLGVVALIGWARRRA